MRADGSHLAKDPMFERLERQMDDLVERLMRRPTPSAYQRAWAPRVDVYETADAYICVVELAGIEPSAVTVEVEGEQIAITGTRLPARPGEEAECLQLEIPFGEFERRLALPSPVDAGQSSADSGDGLLTIRLPKIRRGPTRVKVDGAPRS